MRAENGQPHRAVLMVGKTPEEAEARLRAWFAAHPEE
jgi:predicted RNase H-like HicB family nuclease